MKKLQVKINNHIKLGRRYYGVCHVLSKNRPFFATPTCLQQLYCIYYKHKSIKLKVNKYCEQ